MLDYNFNVNNKDRLGDDSCLDDQRTIQDNKSSSYLLQNYYPYCPMTSTINIATAQPNVFYKGGYGLGNEGCNVDQNSELLHTKITKPACKLSLEERLFLTVPYLGRGNGNVVVEDELRFGKHDLNKKSVNNTSEMSFQNYKNYPLIDEIKETINNPEYLVESVADKNWVRGGLPSRDIAKNNN